MSDFRDPTRLTRTASIIVGLYMVLDLLFEVATAIDYSRSPGPLFQEELLLSGLAGIPMFLSLLASYIAVGLWTYRANANAHALSGEMTISPGWAVGWHFVPIANLFKPFQAMKETWMASHYRGDWHSLPTPPLMFWWWTLWIVTNILSNASFQMAIRSPSGTVADPVVFLDVLVSVLNVPLCLILIGLMRRVAKAQLIAFHDETFA